MKAKLNTPPTCPTVDKVRDCILHWEAEVRKYCDMSGKTFDEDDRIGALIHIVPPMVQDHIRLNPEKANKYDDLRKLVFAYAAAKEEAKPIDMELGIFQKSSTSSQGNKGGKPGSSYGGKGGYGAWNANGYTRPLYKGESPRAKARAMARKESSRSITTFTLVSSFSLHSVPSSTLRSSSLSFSSCRSS